MGQDHSGEKSSLPGRLGTCEGGIELDVLCQEMHEGGQVAAAEEASQ